jgi:hypothetical protein
MVEQVIHPPQTHLKVITEEMVGSLRKTGLVVEAVLEVLVFLFHSPTAEMAVRLKHQQLAAQLFIMLVEVAAGLTVAHQQILILD